MEETLKRIQSHRGVEGIIIVNKDGITLKSTMDEAKTSEYAANVSQVRPLRPSVVTPGARPRPTAHSRRRQLAAKARSIVRTLDADVRAGRAGAPCPARCDCPHCPTLTAPAPGPRRAMQDDLSFLRIRSRKHELMVAPGEWQAACGLSTWLTVAPARPDAEYMLIVVQNPNVEAGKE